MVRLLVVDDEVDICDFVKNFFKERNFEVDVAYDGKQALVIVEERKPQIVLLDIRMPVMDGLEALKLIQEIDKNIKVIMVTAVSDEAKAQEAKNIGATEYITKPLLLEQLERMVLALAAGVKISM